MNRKNTVYKYIAGIAAVAMSAILVSGLPIQAKITAGDITGGVKAPHVNIAAFHKIHGQEAFKFPDHISNHDIMGELKGKAQYIFMNHTAGLKDGDVITIANDVLRENAGAFEDFGVDCQLVVHLKGDDVKIGGMCEFLMVDKDHREIEHKGVVKPTVMHPGKDWVLLYDNVEDGIAIYADEEIGIE